MLQSILARFRPARESAPTVPQAAASADEWSSLDLDPELASFGAPCVNVEAALAAQAEAVGESAPAAHPAVSLDALELTLLDDADVDSLNETPSLDIRPLSALSDVAAAEEPLVPALAGDGDVEQALEVTKKTKRRRRAGDAKSRRVSLRATTAWRLPGVDGTPVVGADDSVERVQFDFSSLTATAE